MHTTGTLWGTHNGTHLHGSMGFMYLFVRVSLFSLAALDLLFGVFAFSPLSNLCPLVSVLSVLPVLPVLSALCLLSPLRVLSNRSSSSLSSQLYFLCSVWSLLFLLSRPCLSRGTGCVSGRPTLETSSRGQRRARESGSLKHAVYCS